MKFSLKEKPKYSKENVSNVFGAADSGSSSEEETRPKAKRPKNADKSDIMEKYRKEGILQAEGGNLESALTSFDEAIQLSTIDCSLFEMKSQILLSLNRVFPAIMAAQRSVNISPTWATAYQTLARAQLGKGEVDLALRNFQKCLHLDPSNAEVWSEDLPWCRELVKQKRDLELKVKFHSEKALEMDSKDGQNPKT